VPDKALPVKMKWSNVGVGKLYRRYLLAFYLLDAKGTVACRQIQADVDPTLWLPGDADVAGSLDVPATIHGDRYTLGLAFVDPTTEKPALHLAIDAPHVERLYQVGDVSVELKHDP
jgi:hypothetical protein